MPESPRPLAFEQMAQRVLLNASNEGEALVSGVRIVFCGLILTRFLVLGGVHAEGGAAAAWLQLPLLLGSIAVSAAARWAARRRRFGAGLLVTSTVLDAVVAHVSLLSTVLWHGPHYTGLLRMPDPAAAIAVAFITALRLSPAAAWIGTAANLLLMAGLTSLDLHVNAGKATYGMKELMLLFIFIGSAGVLASVLCGIARRLVLEAGTASAHIERARTNLRALLREHHDVRTLLSAARLRADLLHRDPLDASAPGHASALVQDLGDLSGFIESVKTRALGELTLIEDATAVNMGATLRQAVEVVQVRFPQVRFELGGAALTRASANDLSVRIVGGARGLTHVVTNLCVNACEGDGQQGARTVRIRVEPEPARHRVLLSVRDDGPGFRPGLLEGHRPRGGTTKAEGTGLGMLLVSGLVEASGGALHAWNPPEGGAQVEVTLPTSA
ncbi:sensor histidine kinase [Corallococcus macrosporus]|uniref:histidine kinase n=1 Tax=Corallococcus macrosporus DSM 14697 TaxID=1189310 RepID=A0A250JXB2_9BACT|nr:HAMP domain-containing sensor histidine kinase [Corallococcus macrosporus]ATB48485.1 histidine kinase [Corallococcus macrosporus DSM 14697]